MSYESNPFTKWTHLLYTVSLFSGKKTKYLMSLSCPIVIGLSHQVIQPNTHTLSLEHK